MTAEESAALDAALRGRNFGADLRGDLAALLPRGGNPAARRQPVGDLGGQRDHRRSAEVGSLGWRRLQSRLPLPRPSFPCAAGESAARRRTGTCRESRANAPDRPALAAAARCARRAVLATQSVSQLANHQFAERVVEIRRIVGAACGLLARVARILEGLFAGTSSPIAPRSCRACAGRWRTASRTSRSSASHELTDVHLRIALGQTLFIHHFFAVMRPAFGEAITHPQPFELVGIGVRMQELQEVSRPNLVHRSGQSVASLGM